MRTTMAMAGLLAGLMTTAALAQEAPPGAAPKPLPQAEPAPQTSEVAPEAPPGGLARRGPGPRGGDGSGGPGEGDAVPNTAPLDLATYDTDGDGRITPAEIEARKAARFAEADANRDGALSAAELLALEDAIREEVRLARATARIERIDDNGDGLLQAAEIEARTPRIAPIFDRLDADGDGTLSGAELDAGRGGGRGLRR